jgi:hypothetical protein
MMSTGGNHTRNKNPSQWHYVYHKSHTDWHGFETGPPVWRLLHVLDTAPVWYRSFTSFVPPPHFHSSLTITGRLWFRLRSHSSLHIPILILVIISLPTVRPPEFHFLRVIPVSLPRYSFIYSHIMQRQNRYGYSYTTSPPGFGEVRSQTSVVCMLLSTVTIRVSQWIMQMKYRIWCLCDRASLII